MAKVLKRKEEIWVRIMVFNRPLAGVDRAVSAEDGGTEKLPLQCFQSKRLQKADQAVADGQEVHRPGCLGPTLRRAYNF